VIKCTNGGNCTNYIIRLTNVARYRLQRNTEIESREEWRRNGATVTTLESARASRRHVRGENTSARTIRGRIPRVWLRSILSVGPSRSLVRARRSMLSDGRSVARSIFPGRGFPSGTDSPYPSAAARKSWTERCPIVTGVDGWMRPRLRRSIKKSLRLNTGNNCGTACAADAPKIRAPTFRCLKISTLPSLLETKNVSGIPTSNRYGFVQTPEVGCTSVPVSSPCKHYLLNLTELNDLHINSTMHLILIGLSSNRNLA